MPLTPAPAEHARTLLSLPRETHAQIARDVLGSTHHISTPLDVIDLTAGTLQESPGGLCAGTTNFMLVCREFCDLARDILHRLAKYQSHHARNFVNYSVPRSITVSNACYIRALTFKLPIGCASSPATSISSCGDIINNHMPCLTNLVVYTMVPQLTAASHFFAIDNSQENIRGLLMLVAAIAETHRNLTKVTYLNIPGPEIARSPTQKRLVIKLTTQEGRRHSDGRFRAHLP